MSQPSDQAPDFDRVVVVTPWYPTAEKPMWGTFVRDAVVAMNMRHEDRITVVHVDNSPAPEGEEREHWVEHESRPEADVMVIRVPFSGMVSRSRAMEIHREVLREYASDLLAQARIVSAHVGGPTGAAVAPLLARRTRFTITEHATYVKGLFNDDSAAVQYRAAVARAQRVLAVSDQTAHTLRSLCPQQADIISAVPNPVRFDVLPTRAEPVRAMKRWLFVGNLVQRKGVVRLLEAFHAEVEETHDPELRLTFVGDGPQREELEQKVAEWGLTDQVVFIGQVDPADVPPYYLENDVLVHLSDLETFGITLVEAAATGLPIVVTRCGGPQETMVVPAAAGLATFVDVDPSVEDVRAAVASLRTDATADELREVRHLLRTFYGFERVSDLLHKYVFGVAYPPAIEPLGMNIVIIFDGPRQWKRVANGADRAADMTMNVVAADLSAKVNDVPAGVRVIGPGAVDRYNTLRTVERTLVQRLPRLILGAVGALLGRTPVGDHPRTKQGLAFAAKAQRKLANLSYKFVYRPQWRLLKGQVVAQRLLEQPELDRLETVDVIVHFGGRRSELLYRLAKRHPDAILHHGPFSAAHVASWWTKRHPIGGRRLESGRFGEAS